MPSSTSHSSQTPQARILGLLLAALLALAGSAYYSLRLNPEIGFLVQTRAVQDTWARQIRTRYGSNIVVAAGSSGGFSINGQALDEEAQLPVTNRGLNAGLGARVIILYALDDLHAGDTLVLALEPVLFSQPVDLPAPGVQFSLATGHSDWVFSPPLGCRPAGVASAMLALRPGAPHVFLLFTRMAFRQPLYHYSVANLAPSGRMRTSVRLPLAGLAASDLRLTAESRRLLRALRAHCDAHGVRIVYSLPWGYTPAERVDELRRANLNFLLQLIEIIPVLKDPLLGANPAANDFSDNNWHLTEAASARRTGELAAQLKEWRLWSTDELRRLASATTLATP